MSTEARGLCADAEFVRIKRIRMVGFRSFQDYVLELPPGLVFVCGPNESGKTGIMKAVQLGFFTDAATTRQDVRRLASWGSEQGFRIELTLDTQDGEWEIVRDFEAGSNILIRPDGTRVRDKYRILEIVSGLLGLPQQGPEAAYTASLCVPQDELATGPEGLQKLIETRVLGGGVDVVRLANDAARRISDLRAGLRGGSRLGELTLALNRVEELETRLKQVTDKVQQGQHARAKLLSLTEEVEQLEREIKLLERKLENAKIYAQAKTAYERERGEFMKVYNLKQKREQLVKQLEQLEPDIKCLSERKAVLHQEASRKFRLEQLHRDISEVQREVSRLSEIRDKAAALLVQARQAEVEIQKFGPIDPAEADEAVRLNQLLAHQKESLRRAEQDCKEYERQLETCQEDLKRKSQLEARLSLMLETRKHVERVNSLARRAHALEQAIRQHENAKSEFSVLMPVSAEDVNKAMALAAEIAAMSQMPAGLDVEIIPEPGVYASLSIDGGPLEAVEPGATRVSALKQAEVVVPDIIGLRVMAADAEQFLAKLQQSRENLTQILDRYGVATPQALSEAFQKYRDSEAQVQAACGRLRDLVSAAGADVCEADLSTVAKKLAQDLRTQAQQAQQAVVAGLKELAMDQEELEKLEVSDVEEELQTLRREIEELTRTSSRLRGGIEGLRIGEIQETVKSITRSIDSIFKQAGCTCLEDLIDKAEKLQELQGKAKDLRSRAQDLLGDWTMEVLEAEISALSQDISRLEEERQDILALGPVSEDLEEQLERIEQELSAKQRERDQVEGQIRALDEADLDRRESDIALRLAVAQREMNENIEYKMSPEGIGQTEIALDEKRQLFQELVREKDRAEGALEGITEGIEDVARVEEQLDSAKRQLERIEREIKILEILRDTFPEARSRAVSGVLHLLSEASSRYIRHMTKGRYTKMEISQDLSPLLYSESRGKPINGTTEKELLSSGTADQVLLAVRLAIADLMSQGKCPPIIMDDPFIHFDAARRQAAIEILREVSGRFQVIVFTCHDYPEIAVEQKVRLNPYFM